jgi:hypothetical protein
MKKKFTRRDFMKAAGAGVIGLQVSGSFSGGIIRHAGAAAEEETHKLLMKGTLTLKALRQRRELIRLRCAGLIRPGRCRKKAPFFRHLILTEQKVTTVCM